MRQGKLYNYSPTSGVRDCGGNSFAALLFNCFSTSGVRDCESNSFTRLTLIIRDCESNSFGRLTLIIILLRECGSAGTIVLFVLL